MLIPDYSFICTVSAWDSTFFLSLHYIPVWCIVSFFSVSSSPWTRLWVDMLSLSQMEESSSLVVSTVNMSVWFPCSCTIQREEPPTWQTWPMTEPSTAWSTCVAVFTSLEVCVTWGSFTLTNKPVRRMILWPMPGLLSHHCLCLMWVQPQLSWRESSMYWGDTARKITASPGWSTVSILAHSDGKTWADCLGLLLTYGPVCSSCPNT